MFKLISQETNAEVMRGEVVRSFKGEQYILDGFAPPRHEGSTGRIYVLKGAVMHEFYPSVCNLKIVRA